MEITVLPKPWGFGKTVTLNLNVVYINYNKVLYIMLQLLVW